MLDLQLVTEINESPYKVFLAITGGGQTFIGDYLSISGASKTIVGAIVPYAQSVFDKFVGKAPENYCGDESSRKLALAAYRECVEAEKGERPNAIGVGVTCSLAKDNERVGRQHKAFVCIHSWDKTAVASMIIEQGDTRANEEFFVKQFIFNCLCKFILGKPDSVHVPTNRPNKDSWLEVNGEELTKLVNGTISCIPRFNMLERKRKVIYSGSWNPLHDGHIAISQLANEVLNAQVILELSVRNADKGALDYVDISNRLFQFQNIPYILTNEPTFAGKAMILQSLFPDSEKVFVVGADTWNRIFDPKYGYSPAMLEKIFKMGNFKFLVFPREGSPILDVYPDLRIRDNRVDSFKNSASSTAERIKALYPAATKTLEAVDVITSNFNPYTK